ncbi:MAG: GIY-YIG nuclease family protein [Clostridia bacterium]|nr:GIY-YIG nuclease family protein [Clostridia bacterium]
MKFYFWKHHWGWLSEFNILCEVTEEEKQHIVLHFNDKRAESVSLKEDDKLTYYYLVNSESKMLTPLPKLAYAFGGQYNADSPVGEEYKNFSLNLHDFDLFLIDESNNKLYKKPNNVIRLNDLLKLTDEEIKRAKIRFNQSNGIDNPIEIFKTNPQKLLDWNYWNSQSYKAGQLSIGFVKMRHNEWLLFTIGEIAKVIKHKRAGVDCQYRTLEDKYGQLFGRVIVKYHKKFQSQFPNASTVIEDLEVKEILPSVFSGFDFPGYDKVSLTYSELETILNGNHPSYRNALENQQAVYLLTDTFTGKLYVGSATSKSQMLLSRWAGYISTYHNENKGLKKLFELYGGEYFKKYFKYSIIENFNSKVNPDFVLERESYWKEVLSTRKHGYNQN